jgi:hypothetical protein
VAWAWLHEGVRFIEQGHELDPKAKKQRARILTRALRKLGYEVAIRPINPCSSPKLCPAMKSTACTFSSARSSATTLAHVSLLLALVRRSRPFLSLTPKPSP